MIIKGQFKEDVGILKIPLKEKPTFLAVYEVSKQAYKTI